MQDFDRMIDKFHKAGTKVLLNFVPNHTSNMHDWLKKSVKRINPYTDYFIWKDAKYVDGVRSPPNNWVARFTGPAWEWNDQRQQYYLHQFLVEQPDLDYRNPKVHDEIKDVMDFWLKRGLDGFRIDAICFIYERADFADEPESGEAGFVPTDYSYWKHVCTRDQPENVDLAKELEEFVNSYKKTESDTPKILLLECYGPPSVVMPFYGNDTRIGAAFPFNFNMLDYMNRESDVQAIKDMIAIWLANMPEGKWANWVISNHDRVRIATRMDNMLLDGIHMLQMVLPGTAITYYGDELGMEDTYVRWDQATDTFALNVGPDRFTLFDRGPSRSPFPWDDSKNAGFSDGPDLWLPINPNYWMNNMKLQTKRKSHLKTYQALATLRKSATFIYGDADVFVISKWVLALSRSYKDHPTYIVVINFNSYTETVDLLKDRPTLPHNLNVQLSSLNASINEGNLVKTNSIVLRPKAALLLTTARNDEN